ncbi:S8 family serine peptidase [Streptomyces sp. NPDC059193]|uniref:S8 family serine peptidase n=1 Tax=Streptomyces sp. NPDC059193 TaxID=3346763 RepID=UPI00367C50E6
MLHNDVASRIMRAPVRLRAPGRLDTYRGEGQIIAIADTGLDTGDLRTMSPAFAGRIDQLFAWGRKNPDRTDDPHGHGTHVAGSALGSYRTPTGGWVNGTAPEARLVMQSTATQAGGVHIPDDITEFFQQAYDAGARIHSNLWGFAFHGQQDPYTDDARNIDRFVQDHPGVVILVAAGNAGTDANGDGVVDSSSIIGPAACKNCITVGASESIRNNSITWGGKSPLSFPVQPLRGDAIADSSRGMSATSSRGPTREGRIKPDVVAPGTSILSVHSRNAQHRHVADGVSADPNLTYMSGTSRATPLTAGSTAVLREILVKSNHPNPSAALIKGVLINGARPLTGQYNPSETGATPNNNSGFGRVDLQRSAEAVYADATDSGFHDHVQGLRRGDSYRMNVEIPRNRPRGSTLKATLVWTDPPGPDLMSDLDLRIHQPGKAKARNGNSGMSARYDRVNNVEQVTWTNPPRGTLEIKVAAHRVHGNTQPFALVWSFHMPHRHGQ